MAEHIEYSDVKKLDLTTYEKYRPKLESGDLFFCSGNYLMSKAIRKFSKSPWSHVGLIFRIEEIDRVLLLESVEDFGVRLAPLSKYLDDYEKGRPYDGLLVFARMTKVTQTWVTKMASFGCDELTRPYDEAEIAQIAARIALGIGRRKNDKRAYICSELVNECFKAAGYNKFETLDGFISPEAIWVDQNVDFLARVK
jgi:hypothetical protein